MKTIKTISLCLVALGLAVSAQAISITDSSLLGTWDPASKYNNPSDSETATNYLVNWENGGTNPNTIVGIEATFALGAGFAGMLPEATFVDKDDNADDGFGPIDSSLYSYVLAKYGNVAYVYYLGDLAPGEYTLDLKYGGPTGNGLSHVSWFSAPGTSVPDGGTTALLLGLGLVGMSFIARRRAA